MSYSNFWKKTVLKAAREKWNFTDRNIAIWTAVNFSFETTEDRRTWHNIFQVLKEMSTALALYPIKISCRNEVKML